VSALVQGSRLDAYKTTLSFNALSDEGYCNVVKKLARNPMLTGRLLTNDLPMEIEEIFKQEGVELFPAGKLSAKEGEKARFDVTMSCNCPDWTRPCKHIVSVMLLLCEEISARPSTLLALRGLDIDEIYPFKAQEETSLIPEISIKPGSSIESRPDVLIKRLGAIPFWRGEKRFVETLSSVYNRSAKTAKEILRPSSIDLRYDYPS
jgi:uncharacterized Zn finger protein